MRKLFMLLILVGITAGIILTSSGESSGSNRKSSSSTSHTNFTDYKLISHAMGSIQNQAYTNSYEAFVANYEQGNRVFEVDLLLTEDHQVVARHEWTQSMTKELQQEEELPEDRQAVPLTHKEFKESDILGKLKPLDWGDILDLMEEYPDIYMVTDTKEQQQVDILSLMVKEAEQRRNPKLLQRIVPQIYDQPMLKTVQGVYEFPSIIYTLYASKDTDQEVIDFVTKNKITGVTMPENRTSESFVSKLNKVGVVTYVHTINDIADMKKYEKMGIYGFYTDDLSEMVLNSANKWYLLGSK
ncbi:phosphatidylinositol-specific phospholipase C/glycerophosphodiester phosphodiesterase family protein [Paenibacillus macquariensis]|nr:phosphatidylinositol-specific phospholipase C/glycerophosphodiester phosphodiesterase family protein [Paenibacillus macquariensis]MEC0093577.1 phosphatidylinositol-specific phospholipase C/glycerophosphodiester phosphodiesterase family protein [Paenibacillus macquariensis]OAB35631.1 glycerophosphodiester phosphodiesterase [Paenibacillus macquariensis subsp. macquariensis]